MSTTVSIKNRYIKRIEAFGAKIRATRELRDYTQEELAAKAGLSFTTINRIEQGHVNPSLATVYALAEVLNLKPEELV